jgi:hypothetical protein
LSSGIDELLKRLKFITAVETVGNYGLASNRMGTTTVKVVDWFGKVVVRLICPKWDPVSLSTSAAG